MISKILKKSMMITVVTGCIMLLQLYITNQLSIDKELLEKYVYLDFIILSSIALGVFGGELGAINAINELNGKISSEVFKRSLLNYIVLIFPVFLIFSKFTLSVLDYFIYFLSGMFVLLNQLQVYFLRAKEKFIISSLVERIVWVGFAFFLLVFNVKLEFSLLIGIIIANVVGCLYIYIFMKERCILSSQLNSREVLGNSKYITITAYLIFLYERLDQFLISIFISPVILASYFVAQKLAFLTKFLTRSVYQVTYPLFNKQKNLVQLSLHVNSFISFCFSLVIVFYGEYLLSYFNVRGKDFYIVIVLLSFSVFISSLNNTLYQYVNYKGGSNYYMKNALFLIIVQLIFVIPFMFYFSFVGVAISRLVVSCIGAFASMRDFKKVSKEVINLKPFFLMFLIMVLSGVFNEKVF